VPGLIRYAGEVGFRPPSARDGEDTREGEATAEAGGDTAAGEASSSVGEAESARNS
jgi:hypothetical protein